MGMSPYVARIRAAIGHDLLLSPSVCAIIHNERGEVLLMQRQDDNKWDPPGGHIDPNETPAQAAERETYEESGLIVKARRIVGVLGGRAVEHCYPNGDRTQPLIVCFACDVIGGALQSLDGEAKNFGYFAPDALPKLSTAYTNEILFHRIGDAVYFQT